MLLHLTAHCLFNSRQTRQLLRWRLVIQNFRYGFDMLLQLLLLFGSHCAAPDDRSISLIIPCSKKTGMLPSGQSLEGTIDCLPKGCKVFNSGASDV